MDSETSEIVEKIIDLLYTSIKANRGEGDAFWLTEIPMELVITVIQQYDDSNNTGWVVARHDDHIRWGWGHEGAIITNDKEFYHNRPSWIELSIIR